MTSHETILLHQAIPASSPVYFVRSSIVRPGKECVDQYALGSGVTLLAQALIVLTTGRVIISVPLPS